MSSCAPVDRKQDKLSIALVETVVESVRYPRVSEAGLGWQAALLIVFLLTLYFADNATLFLDPPVDKAATLGQEEEASISRGSILIQLTGVSLGLICLWAAGWKGVVATGKRNRLALGYFLFLLCGLFYSASLELTFRRLVFFTTLLAMGTAATDNAKNPIRTITSVLYIFCGVFAAVTALALCRSVIQGHAFFVSPFSVYGQPHRDAEMLGLGIMLNRMREKVQHVQPSVVTRTLFYFLSPLALLLTLSRTAIVGFLLAYGALLVLENPSRRRVRRGSLLAFCLLVLTVYLTLPENMLEGVLRQESWEGLQGRTGLWDLLISLENVNWTFGAGYGAFWSIDNIGYMEQILGWAAPAAHNGFLDVLLNTGMIGLAFILALLVQFGVRIGKRAGPYRSFLFAYLVFLLVQNLSQGSFQSPRQFFEIGFWWLFLAVGSSRPKGEGSTPVTSAGTARMHADTMPPEQR